MANNRTLTINFRGRSKTSLSSLGANPTVQVPIKEAKEFIAKAGREGLRVVSSYTSDKILKEKADVDRQKQTTSQNVPVQAGTTPGIITGTPEQLRFQIRQNIIQDLEQKGVPLPESKVSGKIVPRSEFELQKAISYGEVLPKEQEKIKKGQVETIDIISGYTNRQKALKKLRGETLSQKYLKAEEWTGKRVVKPIETWFNERGITEDKIVTNIVLRDPVAMLSTPARKQEVYLLQEQIRGVREKPLLTSALFGASLMLPILGRGAASGATATGITKIPGVVKGTNILTKIGGASLLGFYGYQKGKEIYESDLPLEERSRIVYRAIGTEIVPIIAGAKTGEFLGERGIGFVRTLGRKEIPLADISSEPISVTVAGKKITPASLKASFEEKTLIPPPRGGKTVPQYAGLPGETGNWAWHATPGSFGKSTTAQAGNSELPGLYVSPQLEAYFLKVGGAGESKLGFGFPVAGSPVGLRVRVRSFEEIPRSIRIKGKGAISKYLMTEAEQGRAYMPLIKAEYEGIIPPGTPLEFAQGEYFVKVNGVRVPLNQYLTGTGGVKPKLKTIKIKSKTAKEIYEEGKPSSLISPYQLSPSLLISEKGAYRKSSSSTKSSSSLLSSRSFLGSSSLLSGASSLTSSSTSRVSKSVTSKSLSKSSTTFGGSSISGSSKEVSSGKPSYSQPQEPYIPPPPKLPKRIKQLEQNIPRGYSLGYIAQKVKNRRWVDLHKKILSKRKAGLIGQAEIDNTIAATFRLRKAGLIKKKIGEDEFRPSNKFRNFEIFQKTGRPKRALPPDTYIEKRTFRLDRPGELRQISSAKRKKKASAFGIFGG